MGMEPKNVDEVFHIFFPSLLDKSLLVGMKPKFLCSVFDD